MTPVSITSVDISYAGGTTTCRCRVQASSIVGDTYYDMPVQLPSTALSPEWSDAELCQSVAEALNIPVSEVTVADPGAP